MSVTWYYCTMYWSNMLGISVATVPLDACSILLNAISKKTLLTSVMCLERLSLTIELLAENFFWKRTDLPLLEQFRLEHLRANTTVHLSGSKGLVSGILDSQRRWVLISSCWRNCNYLPHMNPCSKCHRGRSSPCHPSWIGSSNDSRDRRERHIPWWWFSNLWV
jgi:hypothetical protein